ncbi:MAG: hypothetical protein H6739_02920 [Alphaproteobacteria bacterium]|nr:hypothetical protein [Alphaproteobacteria bacterium]
MLVLAWLACAPPSPSATERRAAATATDPDQCAQMVDPVHADECRTWVAGDLASDGQAAQADALCAQNTSQPWSGECFFLVNDALDAIGEPAAQRCARAGPFRGQCLGHAAAREGQTLLAVPGRETEALGVLTARFSSLRSPEVARAEAREAVIGQLAARAPGQPFSAALCGDADEALCGDALQQRISTIPAPEIAAACGRRGAPLWDEGLHPLAAERICGGLQAAVDGLPDQ